MKKREESAPNFKQYGFFILLVAVIISIAGYFDAGTSEQVTGRQLGIALTPNCFDNDADSYSGNKVSACGSWDCNDNDPAINPGVRENCKDGIDQDCDHRADCADVDCDTKNGGGGRCEYGVEITCDDTFDNDADGLVDCDDIVDCDADPFCDDDDESIVTKWHMFELPLEGPNHHEKDSNPNPYTDYDFFTTFTHQTSGKTYVIEGFFDADSNGGASGDVWKVRFAPDEEGIWDYTVSFRLQGSPMAPDGTTGTLDVLPRDPSAPGFLSEGRLEYDGTRYLKFRDGGYFIKGGPDSPENFLAYRGMDGIGNKNFHPGKGDFHSYPNHVPDWQAGDPNWQGPDGYDGKGIIGALNYLESEGMNVIYFLPMNIGGDGFDTYPYPDPIDEFGNPNNDNLHVDASKMQQWDIVFQHAERKGIFLHFVLCEAESPNKEELDDAQLGPERKFFYEYLISRFGHLNALQWNICEEYDLGSVDLGEQDRVEQFANHIKNNDPYDHPRAVHNAGKPAWSKWQSDGFFGFDGLTVASIQDAGDVGEFGDEIEEFNQRAVNAGQPVAMAFDEPRSTSTSNHNQQRVDILWPTYLSGAMGVEWYVGGEDQSLEDFRNYADMWRYTRLAMEFMHDNLPFWQMGMNDNLIDISNAQVMANVGQAYGIYLPNGGNPNLDLPAGSYTMRWYNPRNGNYAAPQTIVSTGGFTNLGSPPFSNDVAAYLLKQ